ncbi:OmpH family outer membrane protein [Ascidiaceihabitans sp.]|uniref:OmpH family outer membrane protein n=1 Tax=Ascidiaceihabitans sp. TaxID=1872644 RepID=UPI00329859DD
MLRVLILCCALVAMSVAPATAQGTSPVRSPVLTIDSDRLYQNSDFGRRVVAELDALGAELSSENRRIEADLEAEELDLTDKRKTMTPEAFRILADAFDEKVRDIRQQQQKKTQSLNARLDDQQRTFLLAAAPILEDLMREAGAAIIIERRDVFLSAGAIDITAAAIARINQTLGAGEAPLPSDD